MTARTKYMLGGAAGAAVVLYFFPGWLTLLIVLGVVGAPIAAYFLLDSSQRRRLHRLTRKQIGH